MIPETPKAPPTLEEQKVMYSNLSNKDLQDVDFVLFKGIFTKALNVASTLSHLTPFERYWLSLQTEKSLKSLKRKLMTTINSLVKK